MELTVEWREQIRDKHTVLGSMRGREWMKILH